MNGMKICPTMAGGCGEGEFSEMDVAALAWGLSSLLQ
jgi:hypothetical protein